MITGATRGSGGRRLANHLADVRGRNVRTETGSTRGLGSADLRGALRELDAGAAGGRTERHAYHLHMDPGPTEAWTDDTWREAWERLETEMGLEDAAFAEVRHVTWRDLGAGEDLDRVRAIHGAETMRERDGGHQVLMAHVHRVYDLCRDDGSVVDTAHDFARREKVARVLEFDHGFDLVAGRHNRAVAARLDVERPEVAAAIRSAGLCDRPRPVAPTTPRERAQAERTGIDPRDVAAAALSAWRASDDGASFRAALAGQGLRLARGDRAVVLVDASGNVHALARVLGKASKADGDRIPALDVAARVAGLALQSATDARPTVADVLPTPRAEMLPETVPAVPPSTPQGVPEHVAADPTHQGEQHGHAPEPPEESPEPDPGTVLATTDLDGQQRLGADQRNDAGRGDPGQPPVAGRARDGSGFLRGVEVGAADSRPDAPLGSAAALGGRGADAYRPGAGAPGGDGGRDRADRAAAGRARIAAHRTERGFAAAAARRDDRFAELTATLRNAPTAAGMAREALHRDAERIADILGEEPYRHSATRDPRSVAAPLRAAVHARHRELRHVAEEAAAAVRTALAALTLRDRLVPWSTPRKRVAAGARDIADRTRISVDVSDLSGDLRDADDRAADIVRGRVQARVSWLARPDVVVALERQRFAAAISEAVVGDDAPVVALAASGSVAAAFEEIRRRQEREQSRREPQDDLIARCSGYGGR